MIMLESGSSFRGYTFLATRCIYLMDFSDQENSESSLLLQRADNSEYNNTSLFFGIDHQYVIISNCVPVFVVSVLNL